MLVKKLGCCTDEVKGSLFKTYCYPLYTGALWSKFNMLTMSRLRVTYNDVFRRLMGVPRWTSARTLFVNKGVRSLDETLRYGSLGVFERVKDSPNDLLRTLWNSDVRISSSIFQRWRTLVGIN